MSNKSWIWSSFLIISWMIARISKGISPSVPPPSIAKSRSDAEKGLSLTTQVSKWHKTHPNIWDQDCRSRVQGTIHWCAHSRCWGWLDCPRACGPTRGPESAGSEPGPACYGKGGTIATVIDADAVLAYLPAHLLGRAFTLDLKAAKKAIQQVADGLGVSLYEAAEGILKVSNETM